MFKNTSLATLVATGAIGVATSTSSLAQDTSGDRRISGMATLSRIATL